MIDYNQLTTGELEVFEKNKPLIDKHLSMILKAFEADNLQMAAFSIADFSVFCFKMGKENHNA